MFQGTFCNDISRQEFMPNYIIYGAVGADLLPGAGQPGGFNE